MAISLSKHALTVFSDLLCVYWLRKVVFCAESNAFVY